MMVSGTMWKGAAVGSIVVLGDGGSDKCYLLFLNRRFGMKIFPFRVDIRSLWRESTEVKNENLL